MCCEKDWIDILQAMLIPMIAIMGIIIAFKQWHTSEYRLGYY
jgi:hypothetical protein